MGKLARSLSFKQLCWIDEYLIDFNGAAAAVRAGYSPKSARAIAHENLGDVYLRLASQSYLQAQRLDATNPGVAPKLTLLRQLFGGAAPARATAPQTDKALPPSPAASASR